MKRFIEMNPEGICSKVKNFYDQYDQNDRQNFYLGLSSDMASRMSMYRRSDREYRAIFSHIL